MTKRVLRRFPAGSRLRRTAAILTALLLACLFLLPLGCPKKPDAEKPEEFTVKKGPIREAVICDGTIQPKTSVEIKSNANGIVQFRGFEAGDVVHEGDVMFRLDKSQIEQQVTQSQARLASVKAQLALTRRNQTPQEKIQYENAVDQAKFDLATSEETYNRVKVLFDKGFSTQQELDDAKAVVERNKLQLELAQKRLKESNAGGTKEQIEVAKAAVVQAAADLSNALEELRYTTIVSPMTGVVLTQAVELGDTVTSATKGSGSGTTLAVVGDLSHVYVSGFVDESDVGKIKLGMPSEVTITSYPGREFKGTLAKIYPQATVTNNVTTFQVDIELDQGQFVTGQKPKLSREEMAAEANLAAAAKGGDQAAKDSAGAAGKPDESKQPDGQAKEHSAGNKDAAGSGKPGGGEAKTDAGKEAPQAKDSPAGDGQSQGGGGQAGGGRGSGGNWKGGGNGNGKGGRNGNGAAAPSGPVEIRIGMTAEADIVIREVPEALYVPVSFVNFRAREPEVNFKNPGAKSDDDYSLKNIKVGFSDGVNIVVEEGLSEGDVILRVQKKDEPPRRGF